MLQRLSGEKANYAGWLCFEKLVMCKQRRKTRVSARCQAGSGPATQGKTLLHASARRRAVELRGHSSPPGSASSMFSGEKTPFTSQPHPCLPCCPVPWQYVTFLLSSLQLSAAPGKASWPLWPPQSRSAPPVRGWRGGSDVRGVQAGPCCPHHNPPARAAAEPQHLILALGVSVVGSELFPSPFLVPTPAPLPSPQAACPQGPPLPGPQGTRAASRMRALAAPFGPPAAC